MTASWHANQMGPTSRNGGPQASLISHLTIQEWLPAGQAGAVVTHSPSSQLQPPVYEDPALRLRPSEVWRDVERLGNGAFRSVMLQECLEPSAGTTRALRAVKKIVDPRCCPRSVCLHRNRVKNEIRAISIFPKERPSVFVQCFGWYEREAAVYLCLEYMPLGNLLTCIDRAIPEADVLGISQQVFRGIQYLHGQGCCHMDIRPPNILVASRPPAREGWRVKIADFCICAFAGDADYAPSIDVRQACSMIQGLVLFRAALPTNPPPDMGVLGVTGEGNQSLLQTGLSELCLGFLDWCDAVMSARLPVSSPWMNGRITAAGAFNSPWMRLRNWGDSHRLTPVARRTVSLEGSLGFVPSSDSRYAFNNTDSGAWQIGVVSSDRKFGWASLLESQAAGDTVVTRAPEIWESDVSRQFPARLFLIVRGSRWFRGEEPDESTSRRIRQSLHPTRPAAVFGTDWHLIEEGPSAPFVDLKLPSRILAIGHSPDGARLLVALSVNLRILRCDAATGLCSAADGSGMEIPYPCNAAEVTAVAISTRKEAVAVGAGSGEIWLGRPTGGSWKKGYWAMIHNVSMAVFGPYLSMRFSPEGDKIVAVSGAGGSTVVSVASAGSLPMGRVSKEVPGALSATLSPDNSQVFVAGWDREAGEAWTEQFAVSCLADGCGECTETRRLNEFW